MIIVQNDLTWDTPPERFEAWRGTDKALRADIAAMVADPDADFDPDEVRDLRAWLRTAKVGSSIGFNHGAGGLVEYARVK